MIPSLPTRVIVAACRFFNRPCPTCAYLAGRWKFEGLCVECATDWQAAYDDANRRGEVVCRRLRCEEVCD